MNKAKTNLFCFTLPNDLKEHLKRSARANRTSISHYIVTLIARDAQKSVVSRVAERTIS